MSGSRQRTLSSDAITEFHHHDFVADQVHDFLQLRDSTCSGTIVDMGGGCGFFAQRIGKTLPNRVRVIDMDPTSVRACEVAGIEATWGDALQPLFVGDESVTCFNLILHHLVSDKESATRSLQRQALTVWNGKSAALFVNEYIYESYFGDFSGWLIYQITKSKLLSAAGRTVSKIVPAFKANTYGVGVRFRSHNAWRSFLEQAGFEISGTQIGSPEPIKLPLRLLFIKEIRRDSFWLVSRQTESPTEA